MNHFEAELFAKYKQHYGYVFYIGKKMKAVKPYIFT